MQSNEVHDVFRVQAIVTAVMKNEMSSAEFGRALHSLTAGERRAVFEKIQSAQKRAVVGVV